MDTIRGYAEERSNSKEVKAGPVVLIFIIGIIVLYNLANYLSLYCMLFSFKLPQGAEVVYRPKTGIFECCAGCRSGIEEIYRVPLDQAGDIVYGKTGSLVVEPWDRYLESGKWPKNVRVSDSYEGDCSYVYDYHRMWDGSFENDGYFYVHVWGRLYLGREGSAGSWMVALFWLVLFLLPPALIVIFVKEMIKRFLRKKKQRTMY